MDGMVQAGRHLGTRLQTNCSRRRFSRSGGGWSAWSLAMRGSTYDTGHRTAAAHDACGVRACPHSESALRAPPRTVAHLAPTSPCDPDTRRDPCAVTALRALPAPVSRHGRLESPSRAGANPAGPTEPPQGVSTPARENLIRRASTASTRWPWALTVSA